MQKTLMMVVREEEEDGMHGQPVAALRIELPDGFNMEQAMKLLRGMSTHVDDEIKFLGEQGLLWQ